MKIFVNRLNIWGRMALHGSIGAAIGYTILHPASMLIYSIYDNSSPFFEAILMSFSAHHIYMALFFSILGGAMGAMHGSLTHRMITLYLKLESMAISDPLTGVYNRRFLMDFLEKEIERSQRYKDHLALILIDIDFFKQYNDTLGHVKGDELLRNISKLFKEQVRKVDIVARYGGEEFSIVLPNANLDMAVNTAQRIRKCVEDSFPFETEKTPDGKVTISAGIAQYDPDSGGIQNFINKADRALYRAKDSGRNIVCSSRGCE